MEANLTAEENNWIAGGANDEEKATRKLALMNLMEMNGLKFEPGIGKSYIPQKNYFQIFTAKNLPPTVVDAIQNALNWDALDRGLGGLAGAGVRRGLNEFVDKNRECTEHKALTPEITVILKAYNEFTATRKDFIPFWTAQSLNVLGLAGAIFNREMHHWNAENIKPQQALMGSLNQQDTIPETEYRKLFYLSIHPIPLRTMENLRQTIAAGKSQGINDAVTSRCRAAPASCGDIHACAQAIPDLKGEPFFAKFGSNIKTELDTLSKLNSAIMSDASSYHSFAANYGKERILVDKVYYKRVMACLCAYIIVNIKGSLAQSAALRKFRSNNARTVQKWIAAFEKAADTAEFSLDELTAE
jgi:hypothetical protein